MPCADEKRWRPKIHVEDRGVKAVGSFCLLFWLFWPHGVGLVPFQVIGKTGDGVLGYPRVRSSVGFSRSERERTNANANPERVGDHLELSEKRC